MYFLHNYKMQLLEIQAVLSHSHDVSEAEHDTCS